MPETQEACWQYQEKLTSLVDDYDNYDDFAVVIQPFFVDAQMPTDGVSSAIILSLFTNIINTLLVYQ